MDDYVTSEVGDSILLHIKVQPVLTPGRIGVVVKGQFYLLTALRLDNLIFQCLY